MKALGGCLETGKEARVKRHSVLGIVYMILYLIL